MGSCTLDRTTAAPVQHLNATGPAAMPAAETLARQNNIWGESGRIRCSKSSLDAVDDVVLVFQARHHVREVVKRARLAAEEGVRAAVITGKHV